MDFQKILPLIVKNFDKAGIRYALIGGVAMGALGIARTTIDLDIMVDLRDLDAEKYPERFVCGESSAA